MTPATHANLGEEWRPVVGYEARYEVSNRGRVRVSNYRGTGTPKELKCAPCSLGYPRVGLGSEPQRKELHVHALVAEAFLGARPDGWHVNHRSGIKTENGVENLEYVTPKENNRHAISTGLINNRGENNCNAKLDESNVREIWRLLKEKFGLTEIAELVGVTASQIYNIREGKSWRWVTAELGDI